MDESIQKLKQLIKESNNIVFFGGAGVSTESGIPDFRSKDGLYNQKYKYPPEEILSHSFFLKNPQEFYKFYKEKMNCLKFSPNVTHYALARLEELGKLNCVITQNIDGLHQKAGSKNVVELHGSVYRNYCTHCFVPYDAECIFNSSGVPKCVHCGNIIKPDVVLYEEPLKNECIIKATKAISECDLLIIGGTSLSVYPAASFINYFRGKNLVIINKDKTEKDNIADLVINESIGKVFEEVIKEYN